MELVEHRRGVQQRLINDHHDHQPENGNVDSRVNGCGIRGPKENVDDDRDELSDCDSETSEVLSVGSEPMPTADGPDIDQDDPRSIENYESDAGINIATRGLNSSRERNNERVNDRSTLVASSPSSRSPSPSPSSSESCNPPHSPVSNYCVTPPQHQPSPSSPAASSVRSPASSSATASSPGRPDAHQEAIVPRYQSASTNLLHQNLIHNHHLHHHHQHPQLTGRYAASAIVSTTRDNGDLVDYPSVVGASTITRLPGIIGHHAVGLTAATGHGTPTVADLIGYSQQSIDASRLHGRPPSAINVPLVARLTLSPPTAMTVTGLQASTPGTAFHPVAVAAAAAAAAAAGRDPRDPAALLAGHPGHLQHPGLTVNSVQHPLLHASSQVQQVAASTTMLHHHHQHHHQQHHHSPHNRQNSGNASAGQHRLSVSKLLQQNSQVSPSARESSSPLSPRTDDHPHQNDRHPDVSRNDSSPGNNGLQNNSGISVTNNNTNHHRNNNNNININNNNNNNNNNSTVQHQGSLKFSIDNILKADFGRRITDPISLKKSRPKKVVPRPIDLTKDFLESSSEGSERGSETSTTNPSPGVPNATTAGNPGVNNVSGAGGTASSTTSGATTEPAKQMLWPAWVYCTRYSDRPSSGPRTRRVKRPSDTRGAGTTPEEKRPRTAFSGEQLARLKREFAENRYLTERRRQQLSRDLGLNEAQIKIWFQNKRAKIKKASGQKNPLALQLMAQGLYNHSTVPLTKEEEEQAAELQAK